jgi:tetratricopeptide (TPR) repeat protein
MTRDDVSRHLSVDEIAVLAEGEIGARERDAALGHLATCRSCMAVYADAVRYRAAWLARPDLFRTPETLVRFALEALRRDDAPPTRRTRPPASIAPMVAVAAAFVIIAGLGFGWGLFGRGRAGDKELPAPIRAALETSSATGLVIPGGERGADTPPPELRSGDAVAPPDLATAVEQARTRYESGHRAPEDGYAVAAGLLALGQLDAARGYSDEARRRAPEDFRLHVLAANIAYRSSDLAAAERELRSALEIRHGDPVASLDLGLVLAEQGQRDAAIDVLTTLAPGGSDPLSTRARRELAALRTR